VLGACILERNGSILARDEKPSAFRKLSTIEHNGKPYILKARSSWRRELVLRLFVIWLTMLLWKRDSEAGGT
jgi:hypothetical protein